MIKVIFNRKFCFESSFLFSGGGDSLEKILTLLKLNITNIDLFGFSDRECGDLKALESKGALTKIFISDNKDIISNRALDFFKQNSCDFIILSYSRLVTNDLFSNIKCFNIHPSLLPAYKGFGAIENAFTDREKLGVTIHEVDHTIDGGKIICNVYTYPKIINIDYWRSISYLMKIFLVSNFIILKSEAKINLDNNFYDFYKSKKISQEFIFTGLKIKENLRRDFEKIIGKSNAFLYSNENM